MVQYRKPVQLSDNIIDRRVLRSPRGVLPASAQAMLLREQQRIAKLVEEANRAAAELRRRRARRG
jgi:hypothetical protein